MTVVSRGIPTHRGWVKKIRFAPGKGNQKLLVMYTDGAEVWDTKEVSGHTPSLALPQLTHRSVCCDTLQIPRMHHLVVLRESLRQMQRGSGAL